MSKKMSPFTVYMILEFSSSLFFSLIFTVNLIYHVTVVELSPLQLVLMRSIITPLYAAWFNLRIDDPRVRATMFSVSSQVDAIGQIGGGPVVGAIGNVSIRAALVTSALILSPVLPLYAYAIRRGGGIEER